MKFCFENLGLLDRAEIELADLTLICGENNTGKTYATYAIYGFLRSWRQILYYVLLPEIVSLLKKGDRYQFDLQEIFDGKIDKYLNSMAKEYVNFLPRAFATEDLVFERTLFKICATQDVDFLKANYQRQVKAGSSRKLVATINKEKDSPVLKVLIDDFELLQRQFGGLEDFIIDAISDIVFSPHLPDFHISSAERTGAAIFRKELDIARARMLNVLQKMDSKELKDNPFKILQGMETGYPWPVEDNVDFVRDLEGLDKREGGLAIKYPEILHFFDEMLGGTYKIVKRQLVFQSKGGGKQRFTMNESSSCIRALLDVGFYLRCKAKPGDLFIIDEPELNLHPKNQRAFARLVARLVNVGVKIFITTHSDYIVKEINTLIMLNKRTNHTRKVQSIFKYSDSELLDYDRVRLYMTSKELCDNPAGGRRVRRRTLVPAEICPDRGINVPIFDDTIDVMNDIQESILFGESLNGAFS